MTVTFLILLLLVFAAAGFFLGRGRALAAAQGDARRLHSLPNYYGWYGAIMAFLPALAVLTIWVVAQPIFIERQISGIFPVEQFAVEADRILLMADIRRVALGIDSAVAAGALSAADAIALNVESDDVRARLSEVGVALGSAVTAEVLQAAQRYRELAGTGALFRSIFTILVAVLALAYAIKITHSAMRARNRVEMVVLGVLMLASTVAILTTIGIVLSMLSETYRFSTMYPFGDFLFGLTWSPTFQGNSQLGLLPLLWGTIYITLVAMLVAVPTGLFTAIYLAEYASPRVRSVVKPLIEVIAGIPTVVFGLFALVTVGPFLREWIAEPTGLGTSGSSVMTAGIVIGILNVPFISSLADDIMNAVPQSLRDGSYGLGATKSETVRQVILPAALPGIVGAILLAASRAIGETMIVTMGAGASAKLDLNPFEAMTTITVKIVSQLTGDLEFNSAETLVAFALGMTLFMITLGLNVFALWVVRRYREQYE
ncbi:phosphate ABC transporter permease subunit PstC [Rhodobacterales bacterium LSUCC0031]|nr:phosphate ABC transporter permease subunit PstC [Rhodobacterales bacterium LSUCC0031]